MTATLALHVLALLGYVAAAILYGANVALRDNRHDRWARVAILAAVAVHTAAIGTFCATTRQSPFANGFGTLSVAAWVLGLAYLPIDFWGKAPSLGAFASPVCSILLFAGMTRAGSSVAAAPVLKTSTTSLHVLLVLLSFALFALAACCAAFYIWQYGLLKRPHRGGLFRKLPPLETVDGLAYRLVAFALPFLTLGLALGFVNAAHGAVRGNYLADPHTVVSVGAWLVYSGYLFARAVAGWRGTRVNYLLIAGLVVTLALYFVPSTTHRFL